MRSFYVGMPDREMAICVENSVVWLNVRVLFFKVRPSIRIPLIRITRTSRNEIHQLFIYS